MSGSLYSWTEATSELKLRLGNRRDLAGSGVSDGLDRLGHWLDSAQARIAKSLLDMPDLEDNVTLTTIDGQSEYDLRTIIPPATEIVGIRYVKNTTTGLRLMRFPFVEFRELVDQAEGSPVRWTRLGFNMAFDPEPDDDEDILIEYRRRPRLGTVELDSEWQEEWLKLAEFIGWQALDQPEKATSAFTMLPARLQVLIQQPLDQDQWESLWDVDQKIVPRSFEGWHYDR
jgi:hypothetical protein